MKLVDFFIFAENSGRAKKHVVDLVVKVILRRIECDIRQGTIFAGKFLKIVSVITNFDFSVLLTRFDHEKFEKNTKRYNLKVATSIGFEIFVFL